MGGALEMQLHAAALLRLAKMLQYALNCLGLSEKKDISVLWPGIEPISQ
jgi:hypothetical protein